MAGYGESQKYFLQSMMQKGIVTSDECTDLLKKSCETAGEDVGEWDIPAFLTSINRQIQPFHLEIRKGNNEDDGKDIYALISITDHDINHLAIGGHFAKLEIEIFRRMVNMITESEEGTVSSTDVLNITDELPQKNISKADVEILISKLLKQHWIGEKDGIIFLSPRSVLELEPYLKTDLKDVIVYCGICRSIVLRGMLCTNCHSKIHTYCAATFFRGRSAKERKCPSCYEIMSPAARFPTSFTNNEVNGDLEELPNTSERRKRRR